MPKDKAYWKAYNQKRQAYLKQKKQESRQRLKGQSTTDQTGKVVDPNQVSLVVDIIQKKVVDINSQPVVDQLTQLIHQYQTATNYHCASGCLQNKYCSNCWYFEGNNFLAYKEVAT
ncbi:MAG: hypothetical protein MRECE_2c029 [Mycoplasmataceae bacterium CE_OT135]|nr:MAG: hypothetical protein MRECE_2c029 [Mycoplasmataceae bacterium CE_OT135]